MIVVQFWLGNYVLHQLTWGRAVFRNLCLLHLCLSPSNWQSEFNPPGRAWSFQKGLLANMKLHRQNLAPKHCFNEGYLRITQENNDIMWGAHHVILDISTERYFNHLITCLLTIQHFSTHSIIINKAWVLIASCCSNMIMPPNLIS